MQGGLYFNLRHAAKYLSHFWVTWRQDTSSILYYTCIIRYLCSLNLRLRWEGYEFETNAIEFNNLVTE